MKAEQPEKTHLEELALLALPGLHVATKQTWWPIDGIILEIFPIIIDD